MKGGSSSAADYGVQLYGFNQTAIPGSGNVIALNTNSIQRGGSNKRVSGGYIVSRKSRTRSKKNRRMKTGGEGSMPNFPSDPSQMAAANTTTPLVHSISINNPHSGGGIITDIAVPAILLTANHLYNPKRKSKKSKRMKRKSRRR